MVLVPFGPLRWYRLVRYDGTDCSATVVPIRPLRWYRLTDTIRDYSSALTLYRHNVKLCQKFYGVLNIFEVVLRNAINNHYRTYLGDEDWIRNQLVTGGMLENHPQREAVDKIIADLDRTGRYSNDRVVSSVSFGFWTHLFSRKPFAHGGQSLLRIFPAKAKGVGQRVIYNELRSIKAFRNRIAHHEAICFDSTGVKCTIPAYTMALMYSQMSYSRKLTDCIF